MKILVFLFMLISSNFVFGNSEVSYFPNELTMCSSCVMKLPQHFTKTEYCGKNENKNKLICGGKEDDDKLYEEIRYLDSFSDCRMKAYNSVLDKFRKRSIKIKEVEDSADELTTDIGRYDGNEEYKITVCLTAKYGEFTVYTSARKIIKDEKVLEEEKKTQEKLKKNEEKEKIEAKIKEIQTLDNSGDNEEIEES